ncbi:exodeoxyribonuclease VII small subunit [Brevibacterium ihuae]|uniref:exodeoxyribonuclease VII small subunit n=1 Tax=Brevibacterium ihuae TaxID=1631743 RepID=UPI000C790ECF|nr:exodeoxyribonuclease VII small subunit [Brevibacterium ihuae]
MTDSPHTPDTPAPDDGVAALSYEEARAELVDTVTRLEAGNLPLEESLRLWERGEALADRCQAWLDGAREKLETAKAARESADAEG